MTPRVAVYTRLSHDPTGEQTATARQEAACRAFAEARGWEVIEVFEDADFSAYQPSVVRPRYERLIEGIRDGRFDGVGVVDIILAQPVTAEFVAGKIYRFFVRDELSPALRTRLDNEIRNWTKFIDETGIKAE